MTNRPPASLHLLGAAVMILLLILGLLAWHGTRAQIRAAWAAARDEARLAGALMAAEIQRDLRERIQTAIVYPDPPVPGNASEADAVLDGGDLAALRRLRDEDGAGFSPAGLPRRMLAAFRICETGGDASDRERLLELATGDAPSVLTPVALQHFASPEDQRHEQRREKWEATERARSLAKKHPETGAVDGVWLDAGNPEPWWIHRISENEVRFMDADTVASALSLPHNRLPRWAALRLAVANHPNVSNAAEVMNRTTLDLPGSPVLEMLALHPEWIERTAREQARWTRAALVTVISLTLAALALMHRAAARERRLHAMKDDFVAAVSHELRAPVASIRLMADALSANKVNPSTAAEFHRLISREGRRLSSLIENVLEFARLESGGKSWNFVPHRVEDLVRDAGLLMHPLARERGVALALPPAGPAVEAFLDPDAIQQALVNLMDNAIKFTPQGATVEVEVRADEREWTVAVLDRGPGIPPRDRRRIFERFQRLGSELRRTTPGTGIGLGLVKAIAEAHDGRVVVEDREGGGSRFELTAAKQPRKARTKGGADENSGD